MRSCCLCDLQTFAFESTMLAMFQSLKFSVSTVLKLGTSLGFSKSASPAASFSLWSSFRRKRWFVPRPLVTSFMAQCWRTRPRMKELWLLSRLASHVALRSFQRVHNDLHFGSEHSNTVSCLRYLATGKHPHLDYNNVLGLELQNASPG